MPKWATYRISQKIVPCLCGCCGGAADSIISVFTQLHRSRFNLEFEILFESILHVVVDLWQRKGKISGCFKTALLLFSSNVKIKYFFKGRVLASY